ncbi:hypothetical protein [Mucilaginibacter psychrotolerans]|uniref:M50 family peptidase n=1 Tax=Mucilaginibacter psychrotolerans TaxID=1524096 RepID=A0A4Y8SP26_9SPHI|nr:hypothetical protein [Mucilaginibacter psychrotolerans]TFF40823.1 hypothetical protein E2R66_01195 [Mucilaginibacter psychrotolerans]
MKIPFTWQYCLAFMAFVFVFGQLHETAHLTAAYFVCGQPGIQRDFNLWTLSVGCENSTYAYVPTIFGPVFSYVCMWIGFFMLRTDNKRLWPAAFLLVVGNVAFARVLTAALGGGDETTVLKALLAVQPIWFIKALGFVLVFSLAFPPLYMVYKRLANKHRVGVLAAFCVLPLIIMMLYEFILLGKVIEAGVLPQAHFLGIADFIYVHTALMAVVVFIFRKTLFGASSKSLT